MPKRKTQCPDCGGNGGKSYIEYSSTNHMTGRKTWMPCQTCNLRAFGIPEEDLKINHSFIGKDHPPNYKRVGSIDVADPADVWSAQEAGYKIGTIYDGEILFCSRTVLR